MQSSDALSVEPCFCIDIWYEISFIEETLLDALD